MKFLSLTRKLKMQHTLRYLVFIALSLAFLTSCTAINIESPVFSFKSKQTPESEAITEQLPESARENAHALQEDIEEQLIIVEEIIIGMLILAVLVGIIARRLRVPYTVGLVILGLLLTLFSQVDVNISPTLILALLVPPLIYEAAFHLDFSTLRDNWVTILMMAVPGVILTTLIVGGVVAWGTGLALPVAIVFGTLVSATDPVSVVALFRSIGVPKRLQMLLEGESLFNDGTAIVLFDLVLILALTGTENFNLTTSIFDFLLVAGGGLAIGAIMGGAISQIISRIDDYLIETTLTTILAYGAYLLAELLGVSGVLAVVAAGLISGSIGPRGMSPTTRIVVFNFWEYAAFLANSFIFLLIGLRIEITLLFANWQLILWAIAAILLARVISVYTLSGIGPKIPFKWKHVLYWGGLRGAISLALALSLPSELAGAESIQLMAFGVVLFTLLFQGFSMERLVKNLNLVERSPEQDEYERRHAHIWYTLSPILKEHNQLLASSVREILSAHPSVEAEELDTARRESLRAQRSALNSLFRDGVISDETYSQLATEIDNALTQEDIGWVEILGGKNYLRSPINRLLSVIIQEEDLENARSALNTLGFSVTHLPSSGGFLKRRNVTLLIGLAEGHEEAAVTALRNSCRRRVLYNTSPLGHQVELPATAVPVTVGGATIFVFELERFEIL